MLKHVGRVKGAVTVDATTDRADQGSVTVIFDCIYGDSVWVETYGASSLFGSDWPYTVFSGFLLSAY